MGLNQLISNLACAFGYFTGPVRALNFVVCKVEMRVVVCRSSAFCEF